MTLRTSRTTIIALIIIAALPAWGQQYFLYSPQPVKLGEDVTSQEGILVKEIRIKKGDTLYALSRKFRGRGTYFPQILLFNAIKNPNLIYAGNTLRIPVSQKNVHAETKSTAASHKPKQTFDKNITVLSESEPVSTPTSPQPYSVPVPPQLTPQQGAAFKDTSTVVPVLEASAGSQLFEAAVKAYRRDDCRTALELLDRYLADNSGSPLAADANLYKAECYLKLSAQ